MITVYGIANCDTVKRARAWLAERGHEARFHDFKKQGVPAGLLPLSLDFSCCRIGDGGARAVAEKLPAGLSTLSLDFESCDIGEGGARAVRAVTDLINRSKVTW